ncbi:MerC domain-containing protein [Spirosoma arcticum]
MKTALIREKADYIGITGSVLCLIHCLITPIVLMSSALVDYDAIRVGFLGLDYFFVGINIVAVWSVSRHTSYIIGIALWSFLALFAAGVLLEDVHEWFEYVAYVASLGLVVTHIANIRYCRTHHVH